MCDSVTRIQDRSIRTATKIWLQMFASYAIAIVIYVSPSFLTTVLAPSEILSTNLFESVTYLLGVHLRGTYKLRESAIVVVGGDDVDLGQHIALKFSEPGYTYLHFAGLNERTLCMNDCAKTDTSKVSSVRYTTSYRPHRFIPREASR
ncbi:hypothetical protein AcW1_005829 [Taiwanofungus camphoratus]|nr:hypothetical protein AcW1_005829 [Antrodia cinnamomea]